MSKNLVSVTATAPSAWASYLVNGDGSGIGFTDRELADEFAAFLGGRIVSCEDAGFCWSSDGLDQPADCQTYTALVQE